MPFRTLVFSLVFSACLSGNIFASQAPTSPEQQFQFARQLATDSNPEVRYWLEQSAAKGYIPAQKQLAQDYSKGLTGPVSYTQAIYWLTSVAINDPQDQGYLLARFLDQNPQHISVSELVEALYRLSSQSNQQAETAYNHFLEQRFNQMRAKQVSEIAELDKRASEKQTIVPYSTDEPSSLLVQPFVAIGIFGLIISGGWLGYQRHRQNQLIRSMRNESHTQGLDIKIKELEFTNKQLKRQLEKIFSELKKTKSEVGNHQLELACAMFGYTPQAIPEPKVIKLRYRQLSKLYHPDTRGSEEEMKRLNQAFRIITQFVTKS